MNTIEYAGFDIIPATEVGDTAFQVFRLKLCPGVHWEMQEGCSGALLTVYHPTEEDIETIRKC